MARSGSASYVADVQRLAARPPLVAGRRSPPEDASPPPPPSTSSARRSWPTSIGVAAAVGVCFLATVDADVGLGDAPESVTAVNELGIAHAPGYVSYVATARVWTELVPVGGPALRIALFSAFCTAAAAGLLVRTVLRTGASRAAAAVGVGTVVLGASIWFYAGFAKHNAFSLLLLCAAWTLAVAEGQDRTRWRPLMLGAAVGLSLGAAWYAMLILVPAIVVVAWSPARGRVRSLALAVGGIVIGCALVLGYVAARAPEDPEPNWGRATSATRVVELLTMRDFGVGAESTGDEGGADIEGDDKSIDVEQLSALPRHLGGYIAVLWRDLGGIVVVLAATGLACQWRSSGRRVAIAAAVAIAANLAVVALVLGVSVRGFESGLIHGGFLAPAMVMVATCAPHGFDAATRQLSLRWWPAAGISPTVVAIAAACVVVPSLVAHFPVAEHRGPGWAEAYARGVLSDLDPGSAVVVWGAERTFPLSFLQTVEDERDDVAVIAGDGLARGWYREQIADRLGIDLPPRAGDARTETLALIGVLRATRTVYLDADAWLVLGDALAFEPHGLVARVVDGTPGPRPVDPAALAATLAELDDAADVTEDPDRLEWPNDRIVRAWSRAHLAAAGNAITSGDQAVARHHLERALAIDPTNDAVRQTLEAVERAGR
jgi:hypothetical protein